MSIALPRVGDRVLLKDGIAGSGRNRQACRIVTILPAEHGQPEYRIRFDSENFERRITLSDIDGAAPPAAETEMQNQSTAKAEPWFKASSLRIGR